MSLQRNSSGIITVGGHGTLGSAEELVIASYAGGAFVPGTSITAVAFYGALEPGGAFYEIKDSTNTAVTRTVTAGDAYALPDECFGFAALKFVTSGANADILVALKS